MGLGEEAGLVGSLLEGQEGERLVTVLQVLLGDFRFPLRNDRKLIYTRWI